ncbi:hypothetical protein FGO68_gene5046 [Halteria grandinella]|uniref:Amino acid permease n=1 Tax=Halteria grandinella TaxID=5974 RepID=A0A8J8T3J6_HALGN|nr:hypothetical protein FGO68_gene5046 [Halteria grandinella]
MQHHHNKSNELKRKSSKEAVKDEIEKLKSKFSASAYSDEDERLMAQMGYKQELHRGFNAFMNFSFCFTAVAVVSGCSLLFPFGMATGGPLVMIWGWVLGSVFSTIVGASMGEICSSYPSAGSVYHWAGMLASERWAPFASYVCGWFNFLGNAASDAGFAFGFGQVLGACISLGTGGEVRMTVWQQVLVAIAISGLWAAKNLMRVDHQGWFNNASAIYQLLSTVVITATLLLVSPTLSTPSFVFTHYNNDTGMPSVLYVSCIGLLMCLFSFSGYEGGAHMAEETKNASESAPRGIILTCLVTGVTGFVYICGLLFACQDTIITGEGAESDYAVVNVFVKAFTNAAGDYNRTGAIAMTSLLMVNIFFAGFSSMTVTSRIGFAMARDGAFPASKFLYKVNEKTKAPERVIFLVFFMDVVLCLLPLLSTTAFEAITSISAIGYQISYAIPILLRLTVSKSTFKTSSFSLGALSLPLGWLSVIWLFLTSIFFLLPLKFDENMHQTWEDFNWTPVVLGGMSVVAMVYWWVSARKFFQGPKRVHEDDAAGPMLQEHHRSIQIQDDEQLQENIRRSYK